ncbi:alpha/beta hydrolase [Ferruginibacter sp. SUN106]|uniref:alpha/beta hydrolase n=1 Tax=Ferruginibacter sp. SUN106 TaxID=2978348 RepID=UPI003D366D18
MNNEKQGLMKRRLFRWIKVIVLLYFIIGIGMFYLQEYILFKPEKFAANHVFHFNVPFQEMKIPFNETDTMSMVKFFPGDSIRKGVVLYFHGNKQNIERYAKFVNVFTKNGYEVWMEDYPGYGKSTGNRTEEKLYRQALELQHMALSRFGKDSIILYGKSLGSGIAAYVASQTDCKRLILETPYYSIPDVFAAYAFMYPTQRMITYKIPTNKYLQQVKYPITIFHGTNDWVIPYRCASKLKSVLKPTDEFITIEEGTHHNLATFDLYKQKLDSLLKN